MKPWIKLVIIVTVSIAFIAIVGILLRQQNDYNRLDLYLKTVNQSQMPAKAGLDNLYKDLAKFDGSVKAAVELQPRFKEARSVLTETKKQLESIKPPSNAISFHVDLLKFYDDSLEFINDLITMSEYSQKSAVAMDSFSKASSLFSTSIASAKNEKEFADTIAKHRENTRRCLREMQELKPSRIFKETHKVTLGFLENLSAALGSLADATKNNDENNIRIFSSKIMKLANDVQEAQRKGYIDGGKAYNSRLKSIQEHRQELIEKFDKLQAAR